jgi:hypothetical protein
MYLLYRIKNKDYTEQKSNVLRIILVAGLTTVDKPPMGRIMDTSFIEARAGRLNLPGNFNVRY